MEKKWYSKYINTRITEIWGWSPARKAAKTRAQVAKNPDAYKCELCGKEPLLKGEYEVDHIVPSESLTGWDGWSAYITRKLDITVNDLQVLCKKPCHSKKSAKENAARRANVKKVRNSSE